MHSSSRVFRGFILADFVLTSTTILAGVLGEGGAAADAGIALEEAIEIGVLVIWIVALAGLWRHHHWARAAYLAVAAIGLVGSLMVGGAERSGVEASIGALCWLVTGAIIALSFWSPVSGAFRSVDAARST